MIRAATPEDHAAIRAVNVAAFPSPAEAAIVDRLRADGDVLIELVAERGPMILGHIMFSRLKADRPGLYAALGPMSVLPDLQRSGLGSQLVRAGLQACQELDVDAIMVLGHPDYYPRFGFSAETAAPVASVYAGSPAFMAQELTSGALGAPVSLAYPQAFAA
jgi:putative acetyltransferase